MDRVHSEIRKITIGNDLKTGMVYQVGTTVGGRTITRIEEDAFDGVFYDLKSYIVYVDVDGTEKEWKSFQKMPVTIEYRI